jgi:PAS domain S-box-containing protein
MDQQFVCNLRLMDDLLVSIMQEKLNMLSKAAVNRTEQHISFPLSDLHTYQGNLIGFFQKWKALRSDLEQLWHQNLKAHHTVSESLRTCEQGWFHLADSLPAMVCTFLPDSSLTYVNRHYCDHFGLDFNDLIGSQFLEFVPQDQAKIIQRTYLSLTPHAPAFTLRHKVLVNGSIRWHEWTDRAFFDDQDNITHFQAVGQDISAQKAMEKQSLQRLMAKNFQPPGQE